MKTKLNQIFNKHSILPAILVLTAFVYFTLNSLTKINNHLSWDELNYETLSRKGIVYNALEKNSLSFIAFYEIGKARANKDTVLNSQLVKKYNYPDENLNPFYLRHYHPPLANYYWSMFINDNSVKKNDRNLRVSNILLGALAIIAIIISILIAGFFSYRSFYTLFIISSLLLLSKVFNYSFERLNFHTFQFIFSLIFIGSLMRWIYNPIKRNSILLGVTIALMFLALETAAFVIAGAIIGMLFIKKIKTLLKSFWVILISFLVSMFALWPGVIKTLAPIKTWIMYAARLFLKDNDEYAGVSIGESWRLLFMENLILFSFIVVISTALIIISKKQSLTKKIILPYIIALFYLITITPFILNKTYVLPVIGLFVFAVVYNIGLINWDIYKFNVNKVLFLMLGICVVTTTLIFVKFNYTEKLQQNISQRIEFENDLSSLKEFIEEKNNVIAFNGQLLRYYLDRDDIVDMRKNTMANPGYFIRKEGLYIDVKDKLKNNQIGAVIFPKENISYYPEKRTKILEDYDYKKIDLKHFRIFLSQKNSGY